MMLSAEQQRHWQDRGYLVLPDFITDDQAATLRRRAAELVEAFVPEGVAVHLDSAEYESYLLDAGDRIHYFIEPDAVDAAGILLQPKPLAMGKIGRALHDLDPVFAAFSQSPRLAALTEALGLRDPRMLQSQYIFKQPGIGQAFPLHQDATYMVTEPPSVVALWFALEEAGPDNACLRVLPGGHRGPLRARFRRRDDGDSGLDILDPRPWPAEVFRPLAVAANTLVVMHGLLPHVSGRNTSSRSRQAYVLHAIDGACAFPDDNWLRPRRPMRRFNPA